MRLQKIYTWKKFPVRTGAGETGEFAFETEERVMKFSEVESNAALNRRRVMHSLHSTSDPLSLSDQRQAAIDVVLRINRRKLYGVAQKMHPVYV